MRWVPKVQCQYDCAPVLPYRIISKIDLIFTKTDLNLQLIIGSLKNLIIILLHMIIFLKIIIGIFLCLQGYF